MATIITTLFKNIWSGIQSLPIFGFGFTFDKVLLGMLVIPIAISILKQLYGMGTGIKSNIGKNRRRKKSEIDNN